MTEAEIKGFHGTTVTALKLIEANGFLISKRLASWLGFGAYFYWRAEGRAKKWAEDTAARKGDAPALVVAHIELGNCINLLDIHHWQWLRALAEKLKDTLPEQESMKGIYEADIPKKLGWNYADCQLVNNYVSRIEDRTNTPVDTIIAAFPEGKPLFQESWLFDTSHVAIAVRNPACIKIESKAAL